MIEQLESKEKDLCEALSECETKEQAKKIIASYLKFYDYDSDKILITKKTMQIIHDLK